MSTRVILSEMYRYIDRNGFSFAMGPLNSAVECPRCFFGAMAFAERSVDARLDTAVYLRPFVDPDRLYDGIACYDDDNLLALGYDTPKALATLATAIAALPDEPIPVYEVEEIWEEV